MENDHKQNSKKGILMMAVCAAMWSTGGVLIKLVPWNPFIIAAARGMISGSVILIYMLLTKTKPVISKLSLKVGVFMGGVSITFMIANKMTSAANAIVLQYTAPVFLLLYCSIFLKQKFRPMDYLAVAGTIGGIVLFFLDQLESSEIIGLLIAILSGIFFAGVLLCNTMTDEATRMSGIFLGHYASLFFALPFLFTTEIVLNTTTVTAIICLGVFQLGLPYILFVKAGKLCSSLTLTLFSAIEPILNPVWVFLFTGEKPGTMALVGAVIVILSVTLWSVADNKQS